MGTNTTNQTGRQHNLRRSDIVEPELSYRIVGALYRVYNTLGAGHKEQHYQRVLRKVLRDEGISFREQVMVSIAFEGVSVGKYFLDFLIEERVVLEIKQGDYFSYDHIAQVKQYMNVLGLQLGILANFGSRGVITRRVLVNPQCDQIRGIRG